MASASRQACLGRVSLVDAILSSAAFKEAEASDGSSCCVSKLAWRPGGFRKCPSNGFCRLNRVVVPDGLFEGDSRRPHQPAFRIPRLVPLVNPTDERTFAHDYLDGRFPMVAVQLWKLMRSGPAYRLAVGKGLNRILRFDGKIMISSVMPDADIVRRGVDWFIKVIEELKPDVVTTWDVPTYSDHPKMASMNWLLAGLEASSRMSIQLDTPLIGLVAGADLPQVQLSSTCLRTMGFEHQALACHELLVGRQHAYLESCASVVAGNCSDLTLLSCSHPNLFERFRMADHFVGMSWFNQAVRGRRLQNGSNQLLGRGGNRTTKLIGENLIETIRALRKSFPNENLGGV